MVHVWDSYVKTAWGQDGLLPVSGRTENSWGGEHRNTRVCCRGGHRVCVSCCVGISGVGLPMLDAIGTLWVMGLTAQANEAAVWLADHFVLNRTVGTVSFADAAGRVLGGLLSAHHLTHNTRLLDSASALAAMYALARCWFK